MSNAKPFWQSKTVWVQTLAVLSMFIPAVASWVAANPVDFVTALAAVNVLVRFATSGKVSVFSDDDGSGNGSSATTGVGGGSGSGRDTGVAHDDKVAARTSMFPWLVSMGCASLLVLPGCKALADYDFTGEVLYRFEDGAKAGLKIVPGKPAEAFGRIPVYDPETGELKGYAELGMAPKAVEIDPAK